MIEMSLFQEEFAWRGLRLVHDVLDQINPAVDTCIGYATVLGAKIFTEMEGMVEEVSHPGFLVQDVQLMASLAGQAEQGDLQVEGDLMFGDLSGLGQVLCELLFESDGEDGGVDEEDPGQDGWGHS